LAAGVPVVSSYVPSSTEWMFPEPPPIIPAFDAEQVANAVVMALDSGWRQLNRERARHWVDRHHSRERIVADHLHVYQKVLQ